MKIWYNTTLSFLLNDELNDSHGRATLCAKRARFKRANEKRYHENQWQ